MPIARPEPAPAQPSIAPVAESLPVTVVIPVAIAAVVTPTPSEEDHMMRPPAPGETWADIDDINDRRPTPALAHVSPPTVVIRRPAPRLIRNPRPTVRRKPSPITVAIRRPVCGHSARTPHPAVIGRIDPFAVIVQVVNARNRDRYVTRAVRRINAGEEAVVASLVPPIPIVFIFESTESVKIVVALDDDPLAFFNDYRSDFLTINLGLSLADDDLGRAVFVDVDAVNALFDEGHGDGRRVDFEIERVVDSRVVRVNNLELAFVETVDSEIGRAYGQRHLNRAGAELCEAQVGVARDADDVSPAELDFGPAVRAAIKLIVFL